MNSQIITTPLTYTPMITAHSGCDFTEDNSLEFIRYALTLPVDAFEVDIRKNSRGVLILSHDETQEEAVLLANAFEMMQSFPDKKINCDLKQKHIEQDVYALASQYGVEDRLIFTGDVNPELFRKGASVYPNVLWFANIECFFPYFEQWQSSGISEADKKTRLEELLLQMTAYETSGLNWYFQNAELVWEKARELGIGISVWTVNDSVEQSKWLNRLAENITSRNISGLIHLRRKNISQIFLNTIDK